MRERPRLSAACYGHDPGDGICSAHTTSVADTLSWCLTGRPSTLSTLAVIPIAAIQSAGG